MIQQNIPLNTKGIHKLAPLVQVFKVICYLSWTHFNCNASMTNITGSRIHLSMPRHKNNTQNLSCDSV